MALLIQVMITLTMAAVGLGLGLWVDLYRFINRRGAPPLSPLVELLFWAVITAIVFSVLFTISHLELRLYMFLSLGLGLAVYFVCLSKAVTRCYNRLFTLIANLLAWLVRAMRPLAVPFRFLAALGDNLARLVVAAAIQVMIPKGNEQA